ncbi:hypothetical protein BYT27DRAFT_7154095 [Phlegmacium glaucopus]|nr:hypothetical protein BYT27DRAFT_7154095 [Phlegmacium glaucopus]
MTDVATPPRAWAPPLNNKLYRLDEDEKDFFKKETKIKDDEELKQHILDVQSKAYSVFQYVCIRVFGFARMRLARLPAYQDLLKLGRERKGAIFIDLGCCFGNDVRKVVQDGYPVENTLALDLRGDLWHLGHELFKSTPESFPVPFLEGNILDSNFLEEPEGPFALKTPVITPIPSLKTLTSLNLLRGHVSAIYVASFFHLFSEQDQLRIAKKLASLLSPEPGSMLLGIHLGHHIEGIWGRDTVNIRIFCHSPESWKVMWDNVFGKGQVEVKARLKAGLGGVDYFGSFPGNTTPYYELEWSVTRL